MHIKRASALTLLTGISMLTLGACGDATSGDPLTQAEAEELSAAIFEAIGGAFEQAGSFSTAPGGQLAPAAPPFAVTFNDSYPCEGGGTATLAGTISGNAEETSGNMAFDLTQNANGCVVMLQSGTSFTLTGNPNLKIEGEFTYNQSSFSGSLSHGGAFSWTSSDGRAGNCGVDLDVTINLNIETSSGTATQSGELCGISINRVVSVGDAVS